METPYFTILYSLLSFVKWGSATMKSLDLLPPFSKNGVGINPIWTGGADLAPPY